MVMALKTYQDLLEVGEGLKARADFILAAISAHKGSEAYQTAADAELYYKHQNPTIMRLQKFIRDARGQLVPNIYRANNKIPCRYYFYFVTQAVQFLLGNGVAFGDDETKEKLGRDFDEVMQELATDAQNGGVAFGFWNNDHLERFALTEFVPLYDEENGALRAGIRFWQIADDKPLRCTLYEEDGYTEYIRRKGKSMEIYEDKRSYVQIVEQSEATGTRIYDGGNWPSFPIIPLYNACRQSELVGGKNTLDAYDLMASELVNNVDDGNFIYWILKNYGGMTTADMQKFIQQLTVTHVANIDSDEGGDVEAHQIEAPYEASVAGLERLRAQLFDDFMALDTRNIASGAVTATQITAAYEPLNAKTDLFESQVTRFINALLRLIGIDDKPTYTRSKMINKAEEIQSLMQAATALPEEYVTRKILEIEGDIDKAEDVLQMMSANEANAFGGDDE